MDRRHFCKVAALAAGAIGLGGLDSKAASVSKGFRITVLRRECYEDLQALFLDDPETGRCERLSTGQSFDVAPGAGCPDDFCPLAFRSLTEYINSCHNCIESHNGTIIASCPDGSRPVIFRIDFNYNR